MPLTTRIWEGNASILLYHRSSLSQGGIILKKQSNLSRLLAYAGSYKILTYLSWVLSAAGALLALVPFWYIWRILGEVIEVVPQYENAVHVTHYGWMAVVFAVAAVLVYIAGLMCSHLAAFRIATNLRLAMTKHIATLPLGAIEQFGSGKLRRTISETAGATETYLAHQLPDKAKAMATIAGLLALLLIFDWRLGLLSLVPVALAFAVMSSMTGKKLQGKMTQYQNALADMSNEAVEYVRGIPVVKTFGQTVFSFKKFKGTIDNYERWVIAYTKQLRWPMTFYTLAVNSVFVFLIAGGFLFSHGGADGSVLLNLLFYIIITPVISVTMTKLMFMSENAMIVQDAITRIDSVLESPSLSQPEVPQQPRDSSVTLDHVTFSYDGTKNALEDVSFSIGSGQTVAFVGPSGGGKSTLAALIARFFDPQSGSISIGGINVKIIDKNELMETVSFVFQNSHLIKGSILDNVRMGKPDATDEEVLAALRAAQCMDIIEKFPDGVHTVIGSQGIYLSGGEMQKLMMARALYKNCRLLLLDEPTAALDAISENEMYETYSTLLKNKTALFISHRLASTRFCDTILFLENGKIKERGTHDELLALGGSYAHMFEVQSQYYQETEEHI